MSISVANCCPECADATLDYRVIDQVVNESTRTYTIQFGLNCVGINVAVTQAQITLSCTQEECVEVPLSFSWSGGACNLTILLGNSLTCTCDPCGVPCDICIEFVTYNDEPNDPMESDIGATIISSTPTLACTGESFTVNFTVLNNTGGVWQSTPDPDFYLYFQLYSQGVGDVGCTDVAYSGATPTPDRIPSATTVGFANHFNCDWELNMANGASANYSITFTVGSVCDCSDLIAEVGVARGQRKTASFACSPCDPGPGTECCLLDGPATTTGEVSISWVCPGGPGSTLIPLTWNRQVIGGVDQCLYETTICFSACGQLFKMRLTYGFIETAVCGTGFGFLGYISGVSNCADNMVDPSYLTVSPWPWYTGEELCANPGNCDPCGTWEGAAYQANCLICDQSFEAIGGVVNRIKIGSCGGGGGGPDPV